MNVVASLVKVAERVAPLRNLCLTNRNNIELWEHSLALWQRGPYKAIMLCLAKQMRIYEF